VKNAASDIAQNGVNVSVSLTVGHSESQYTQNTSDLLNSGSALKAGKDITIQATGGKDGNINVIGSGLNAQGNITLKADNQVNLLAAQDLETQHSKSKSMSAGAGVGASFGSNGMSVGFTANASLSRGSEDGEGTTQLNTHVAAGQQLSITSGGDTNLKGAVASGNQIVADVKGNLNIESLQDKATFDSKNEGVSVSGTVGVGFSVSGSVNQSKVHNDYASVQEQSGLRAGDGGFQVKVGGNTDLKGGVISSSTAGGASSSLVTATLTHSDIENKATSSGSSISMGGGFTVGGNAESPQDKEQGGIRLKTVGPSGVSGSLPSATALSSNEAGTTRSGIGAGNLVITDDAAQLALTGQSGAQSASGVNRNVLTGSDASGHITNNFDPNATNAALAVTSEFSSRFTSVVAPVAANLVGDIGTAKQGAALAQADSFQRLAKDASERGDQEAANAYAGQEAEARATAQAWSDNGLNRLALHAAAQGFIGGISGGNAEALSSISGVAGGNFGQQLGKNLGQAEADKQGLQGQARNDLINTYQQTFATIGGVVAGMAASAANGSSSQNVLAGAAQAANMAATVDTFNRQLHPEEKIQAAKLAAASNGKYTAAQIDAALRAGGNSKLGESANTGMVVPLTASTTAKDLYDTSGMLLSNTGDGRAFLVQQIAAQVDPELAAYIRANTGGANSPYTWEPSLLGIKPPAAPVAVTNPFIPNSSGCITADCAAGLSETRSHTTGETRFLGVLQATAGAGQAIGGSTLVAVGLGSCFETFGAGCLVAVAGGFEMAAGWDNVNTGTKAGLSAKLYATTGGELLQRTGLSPSASELLYGGIQGGIGYGAAKLGVTNNLFVAAGNSGEFVNAARIGNNFYRDADLTTGLRPSADINKLFAERGYDAPFTDGTYANVSMAAPGTRATMIVSDGQGKALDAGKPAIGGFATPDLVPDQAYARGPLAITPSMKLDVSRFVSVETTGKAMVQIEGKVAPQAPVSIHVGDGNQFFFDYPAGSIPTDYVKPLGPTMPLPVVRVPKASTSFPSIVEPVVSH
jgi:hypothetical protein